MHPQLPLDCATLLCLPTPSTSVGNQPTSLQATSPSAFVSRTQGSSRKQGSSTIYTAVLALAVSVTVVTPGLIGLIIYCRSRKRRDTHQSQWHPAGLTLLASVEFSFGSIAVHSGVNTSCSHVVSQSP